MRTPLRHIQGQASSKARAWLRKDLSTVLLIERQAWHFSGLVLRHGMADFRGRLGRGFVFVKRCSLRKCFFVEPLLALRMIFQDRPVRLVLPVSLLMEGTRGDGLVEAA